MYIHADCCCGLDILKYIFKLRIKDVFRKFVGSFLSFQALGARKGFTIYSLW